MAGSPRIIARPTTRMPPAPVRQGQVFGGAEDAPSLTAAAHDDDGKSGRGGRMLAARVEQKNGMTKGRQKWRDAPLTKKAPYKSNGHSALDRWHRARSSRGWFAAAPLASVTRMSRPPRAATSCMLETVFSKTRSWGAITITGMVSSMSAIGPCLSSPAPLR
jgi:hypothetical protein